MLSRVDLYDVETRFEYGGGHLVGEFSASRLEMLACAEAALLL